MKKDVNIGRLAMRVEGRMWNAYWAHSNTMDGAVLLGSIGMPFVCGNEERKQAFQSMMVEIMNEVITEATGATLQKWDERSAPPNERAGTA